MQCPRCGAITADETPDTLYCSNCGAPLAESSAPTATLANGEASELPTMQIGNQPEGEPTVQYAGTSEVTVFETPQPQPNAYALPATPSLPPMSGAPAMEAGWAEFSGASAPSITVPNPNAYPQQLPANSMASGIYPPQPVPGGYMSPNAYQQAVPGGYPYPYTPGFMPPVQPAPKRRGPLLAIVLSVLVLLLVIGGVFAGIAIGQAHSKSATTQASPTVSPTPDAQQLYQQVTKQSPFVTDSLQSSASGWSVFEKPTYGCEIKSDGLHVHTQDSGHFTYCTSGQGRFGNFAFQVDMKILSGNAGGITFRGDTLAGNLYVFYVYSDGSYRIGLEQNNQGSTDLRDGTIDSFNTGQKNTLTVIAQGNQMYFYANQQFFMQFQDSTYTNGYVGVLADDHNATTEVVYTNAKIWVL